jgi:hypothetical protein
MGKDNMPAKNTCRYFLTGSFDLRRKSIHRKISMAAAILLSAVMAACAANPHVESGSVGIENKDIRAVMVFSASDREKIVHFFKNGKKGKTSPPGLAKKPKLPPGLQKHVEKYGELPPGLEGRRLPSDLERSLAPLPDGYVRMQVGGDVVLMDEKTRVVFDVVWDVD